MYTGAKRFSLEGGTTLITLLQTLIEENYGQRIINISADSIYTGAIGAGLFARKIEFPDAIN